MLDMFGEMVKSEQTLKWKKWSGQDKKQVPHTASGKDTSKPQDATIHFPKSNPNSRKADIAAKSTDKKYNFEAAIMHELMHAYEAMTGTYDETEPETLPTKIGDAVQKCIESSAAGKGKN